jgi:hypothetical protein
VGKKARVLGVPGSFREFQQGLISWTVDALRIGEIIVDDPCKRFKQFFLRTHSARPGVNLESKPTFRLPLWRIPRLVTAVDENVLCSRPRRNGAESEMDDDDELNATVQDLQLQRIQTWISASPIVIGDRR